MATRSYRAKKNQGKALKQVEELILEANSLFSSSPLIANRRARAAKRVAMKHKLRLPINLKRCICKGCMGLLVPGKNCRVRTRKQHVVITCLECKRFMRIGHSKK